MNEETIDFRLTSIEKKLDDVTKLLLQTQAQEIRLNTAEKAITELKTELENKINELEKKKSKSIDRWLSPLVSALVSGGVAFLLVKVGLK